MWGIANIDVTHAQQIRPGNWKLAAWKLQNKQQQSFLFTHICYSYIYSCLQTFDPNRPMMCWTDSKYALCLVYNYTQKKPYLQPKQDFACKFVGPLAAVSKPGNFVNLYILVYTAHIWMSSFVRVENLILEVAVWLNISLSGASYFPRHKHQIASHIPGAALLGELGNVPMVFFLNQLLAATSLHNPPQWKDEMWSGNQTKQPEPYISLTTASNKFLTSEYPLSITQHCNMEGLTAKINQPLGNCLQLLKRNPVQKGLFQRFITRMSKTYLDVWLWPT